MAYRNIMIASSAHVSVSKEQLIITTDTKHSIPLEDISSVLFENRQTTITMATLSELGQHGITVYFCDKKHTPCAIMMPFAQHSRNLGMIKLQEELTTPRKKQLWQQIVKAKIANQALCLKYLGKNVEAEYLNNFTKKVLSGDANNIEATAALYYFKNLFSGTFNRGDGEDMRNSYLNYGYAILRGHIARLIASYGFMPMKGLHHKSELNAYNLADDFIEPLRPIVDLFVVQLNEWPELKIEHKQGLYNLLNMEIDSVGQKHSVSYAAERMIQSFTRCCQLKTKELFLPKLLPLKQHTYE